MNRLDELKRTLVTEADLHRNTLRIERRLLSLRANSFKDDLRENPLGILVRWFATMKTTNEIGRTERCIRVASDVLQLIRDLRRS